MPATRARLHLAVLMGYACVAIAFLWPLSLHLTSALPGPIAEDTGVYVWNQWVFRHEIVANHRLPFTTLEILSLTAPVPLALHNYTTIADIIAFPLLPMFGSVATFNVLLISSKVLSAYAMFLFARRVVADGAAAWIAGLLFGFSPFMSARAMEHFSLVQTAPLVLFPLLFDRLQSVQTMRVAAATGATVGIAFLCDPYYAVYCVLMAGFTIAYSAVGIRESAAAASRRHLAVLNVAIVCLAGVVLGIAVRGGGRFGVLGMSVSMTQLYTPVLLLTLVVIVRAWASLRFRVAWVVPSALPRMRVAVVAGIACFAVISPVLLGVGTGIGERQWISPRIFWRSSPAGLDLLELFVPNPMHPWFGHFFQQGLSRLPHTFIENVASIPWTVIGILVFAVAYARASLPRYWIAFTAFFGLLALGPFVYIAGHNTYVPTPWALLRYLPVVGAARMPTRMIAVVMLGVALLLAFAVRDLRVRVRRPGLLAFLASALLFLEMLPAPRILHSATVPDLYRIVAADPRPLVLLNLPFGLRDGMSSYGNSTSAAQFFQTVHAKPILGGYLSRLPSGDLAEYLSRQVTAALIDLSAGRSLTSERRVAVIRRSHELLPTLNIGYVVVNSARASEDLTQFAREAFDLTLVATEAERMLFRTPLAPPLDAAISDTVGARDF